MRRSASLVRRLKIVLGIVILASVAMALDLLAVNLWQQQRQLQRLAQQVEVLSSKQPATVTKNAVSPISPGSSSPQASPSPQASSSPQANVAPIVTKPTTKEVFIYLGTGQTNQRDWIDQTAATVTLNTASYGRITGAKLEAALAILGGEAHARLKNQTSGAIFYDSEVVSNTSTASWQTSASLNIPAGQNTYIVQLRSTSGEMAILSGARLHLFIQTQ